MNSLEDLQRLLNRAAAEIPAKALRVIGVEGKNFIGKNFRDESFTDSSSVEWAKRKTTDRKGRDLTRYRTNRRGAAGSLTRFGQRNEGRATLVGFDTGGNKLKNSFQYRISIGSTQVTFYTSKGYAQKHNEGLSGMPRRQFMGQSNYLNGKISNKISTELNQILR